MPPARLMPERGAGGRSVLRVLRACPSASLRGGHALLVGGEAAIDAGAVGEIGAPGVILRVRCRRVRECAGSKCECDRK
jgi:hypothetical protein